MLAPAAPQKRARVNVLRLRLFAQHPRFCLSPLRRQLFPDPYFSPPLLLLSAGRALFYLALALLSRTVFNFSSVCGREYISNLSGIGLNINERSIMNERKPRLDAVNQKRLSLGFAVSNSSEIASREQRDARGRPRARVHRLARPG